MKLALKVLALAGTVGVGWYAARWSRNAMDFYLWERELAESQESYSA